MDRKGFTLTELLIVVAIIGILAAIAIPGYIGQQKRAERTKAFVDLEGLRILEEQYYAERGTYIPDAGTCAKDNPGNVALIKDAGLQGFRPTGDAEFSYCINDGVDMSGTPGSCFNAVAIGNTNRRVAGDVFMIDCNNNRNY